MGGKGSKRQVYQEALCKFRLAGAGRGEVGDGDMVRKGLGQESRWASHLQLELQIVEAEQ